ERRIERFGSTHRRTAHSTGFLRASFLSLEDTLAISSGAALPDPSRIQPVCLALSCERCLGSHGYRYAGNPAAPVAVTSYGVDRLWPVLSAGSRFRPKRAAVGCRSLLISVVLELGRACRRWLSTALARK